MHKRAEHRPQSSRAVAQADASELFILLEGSGRSLSYLADAVANNAVAGKEDRRDGPAFKRAG